MTLGKTIKLFLIDGDPNGRITGELSNWTGKAYKIPRIKIKDSTDREELKNPGVYLLFGKNEEGKDQVYVGEAENIFGRLNQQLAQKEFWYEAIAFISKDENLNKAHIRYLENSLYETAKKVNRYQVVNSNVPTQASMSESDIAEMEAFMGNIKILVNTLGHKVFEEKRETKTPQQRKKTTFYIKAARGADASGEPTSDGFLVFKDSHAAIDTVKSLTSNFTRFRDQLIENGTLKNAKDHYIFTEDYVFSSPFTAAVVVMGRNANGLTEWKMKDGTTLRDFEEPKE
jgi:hypothetical protein